MFNVNKKSKPPVNRRKVYPFAEMEVDESFDADIADRAKVSSAASIYGKRNGMKFTVRKINDTTIRCWRIN